MKAVTRLLFSLGLLLALTAQTRAATSGVVSTIGGSYTPGYVDGDNFVSLFNQPSGLAVDGALQRLLIADTANNAIRFISLDDDVAGTFTRAALNVPVAVAVLGNGDVLVVNSGSGNVSRYDRSGTFLSLFATNLANPTAIAVDPSGNVFVSAQAGGVRRYNSNGGFVQSYVISQGTPNFRGIVVARDNTIAVTDAGNSVVWKFPISGGSGYIFAGTFGKAGFANGPLGFGKFNTPEKIGISPTGILVVADRLNHRVRAIDGAGVISTLYGEDPILWQGAPANTLPGWSDGPGGSAALREPVGITVDATGTVFDSEVYYGVIRQVTALVYPTNASGGNNSGASGATKNEISLGFAGGEASSDFVGAPGQHFVAPITLTLVTNTAIYGLQFNTTITPLNASTPDGPYNPIFSSHLMKPIPNAANKFQIIEPSLFVRYNKEVKTGTATIDGVQQTVLVTNYIPVFSPLVITSDSGNLLGVGWLERYGETNLYDTLQQNLITYSQAHDYLYLGSLGKVVVGAASFQIPPNAPTNSQYQFTIGRASANSDGIAQDLVIEMPDGTDPTDSLTATRTLNMGIRKYLVGDVVPFRWFNAGDFGDNSILNNDLEQLQEVFAYGYDVPPVESDMYDALDSCCIGLDGTDYSDPANINYQVTDSSMINQVALGDHQLTLEDLYVTFRRSLDPSLTNYVRYWSGGHLVAEATTNAFRGKAADGSTYKYKKPALNLARLDEPTTAKFIAGNLKAAPGQVVHVPIDVQVTGPLSASSVLLNVSVIGLNNTPGLATSISFTSSTEIGTPTVGKVASTNIFSGIWFEVQTPLAAGTHRLGTVDLVMPATANADTLFGINIDKAQASSGLTRFPVTVSSGMVLAVDRAAAPWTDEIPDAWRIQYFGSLMNILSAPDADADGDGMTNLEEYRAGTNPNDVTSRFAVDSANTSTGVNLKWPSVTGKTYRLESSPALNGAPWTILEDSIPGTGGIIQRTQSLNSGETRFYRVHTN